MTSGFGCSEKEQPTSQGILKVGGRTKLPASHHSGTTRAFGGDATDAQMRAGIVGPDVSHTELRDLADMQAAARGEAEQNQIHVVLLGALGLALQAELDEAQFLAGEDFRQGDSGGTMRDHHELREMTVSHRDRSVCEFPYLGGGAGIREASQIYERPADDVA